MFSYQTLFNKMQSQSETLDNCLSVSALDLIETNEISDLLTNQWVDSSISRRGPKNWKQTSRNELD